MTRPTRGLWIVLALAPFLAGCQSPIVTLYAQSLPLTKTLLWDANPASDQVLNYTVSLDGVVVGTPTSPSQTVTFPTGGTHTLSLTVTNTFGTSAPATLTVNVTAPTKPANLRFQ